MPLLIAWESSPSLAARGFRSTQPLSCFESTPRRSGGGSPKVRSRDVSSRVLSSCRYTSSTSTRSAQPKESRNRSASKRSDGTTDGEVTSPGPAGIPTA